MEFVFLTKERGLLLGPISAILGIILNAIYEIVALLSKDGIANIALCIILFTVIVKMLMLPLTIKQQKSSKLMAKMNPELAAVSEKYKGKKDEASQRRMQLETQAIYEKYGTNPMAGCLPLLISLPIMFALYRVIYAIPAYINDVGDMYRNIATSIRDYEGYVDILKQFITDAGLNSINLSKFPEVADSIISETHVVDILSKCTAENWKALAEVFPNIADTITNGSVNIIRVNQFIGGLNILNNPVTNGNYFSIGVLIPIFAVVTQILQTKLMTAGNDQNKNNDKPDDAVAASMKSMNVVMPIMSGFICFMIPIGVGIYWIISSVVQIVQQLFINRYMEKVDVDEMIAKNQAKMAKRREKLGIATGDKMAEVAKTSTKSLEAYAPKSTSDFANLGKKNYNKKLEDNQNDTDSDKNQDQDLTSGSEKGVSAYANILKNRNQK